MRKFKLTKKERKKHISNIRRYLHGEPPEQIPPPQVNIRLFREPLTIQDGKAILKGKYIAVEEMQRLEHELVSQLGCMPVDADIYRIAETVKKTMKKMIPLEDKKHV